jgi:hypothetical protein
MPNYLKNKMIAINLVLEAQRAMVEFDANRDNTLVALAVGLLTSEKQTADIKSIAALTSLSRGTVARRIEELRQRGRIQTVIDGRRSLQCLATHLDKDPQARKFFNQLIVQVERASSRLNEHNHSGDDHD